MKNKHIILFSILLLTLILFVSNSDIVYAADKVNLDNEDIVNVAKFKASFNDAFGSKFTDDLTNLYIGFQHIARIIVVIMTALAGVMIAFGLGGANQLFFKWIFGVGVALNIADFGWDLFGDYWIDNGKTSAEDTSVEMEKITKLHGAKENDAAWYDIFSNFMNYYTTAFINPAYARLMPIAVKFTLVLWFIDTSVKVALGLTQQDLINFFTKQILKLGIYIFLITNWWNPIGNSTAQELSANAGGNLQLMAVLGDGFESLGYYAAGGDELKDSEGKKVVLQSNSIIKNTMALWSTLWGSLTKESKKKDEGVIDKLTNLWDGFKATLNVMTSPLIMLVDIIILFTIIGMLLYMALDMFMVRVEFYTMAVLSIMLLPFAMIDQLKFLADKAISLMFNLAIKCFVMAFMSVAIVKILNNFIGKLQTDAETKTIMAEWYLDWTLVIQMALLVSFLFLLVKKIPQLCNGLLSGNPSLSGGDVMGQMASTLKVAGMAGAALATGGAGAIAGASAGAASATSGLGKLAGGALGGIKGGVGSMLRGGANYALTQNPAAQGFSQGMNLFSGNGSSPGLMQKGGLGQALGLTTGQGDNKQGVVDRMKGDTGDKSKTGDNANSKGNDTQNGNTPAATGKDGEKTIEKQIGTINEKMDRIERIITGGANPSANPANSSNPSNPAVNLNKDNATGNANAGTNPSNNAVNSFNNASSGGTNGSTGGSGALGANGANGISGMGNMIGNYQPISKQSSSGTSGSALAYVPSAIANTINNGGSIPHHSNLQKTPDPNKHWTGHKRK